MAVTIFHQTHNISLHWLYMSVMVLKSTVNQLFFQQPVQANIEDDIKGLHYLPCETGIKDRWIPLMKDSNAGSVLMQWYHQFVFSFHRTCMLANGSIRRNRRNKQVFGKINHIIIFQQMVLMETKQKTLSKATFSSKHDQNIWELHYWYLDSTVLLHYMTRFLLLVFSNIVYVKHVLFIC